MTDFEVMQRVFDLAAKGGRNVAPNPLVGCVITKNGKIIGEGWHKKYGGHHAEVNAIRDCQKKYGKNTAKKLLNKSTFFVNLEPCSIEKNTPPCTDKIIECKAKKLVCSITSMHVFAEPPVGSFSTMRFGKRGRKRSTF